MKPTYTNSILLLIILFLIAGLGFSTYSYYKLNEQNQETADNLVKVTNDVIVAQKEKTDLVNALQAAADKNQTFATQLSQVTQTVNQLEWLNNLDKQLLQKYSKVYFLNENYTPKELSPIDTKYLFDKTKTIEINDRVLPFLQSMLQAAAAENITIDVVSAYRSFSTQATLKSAYRVTYGSGANSFSADQGYSEHQLGTALDFSTPTLNGALITSFEKASAFTWLQNNAYRFGFILSYPPNNKYYVYEPWHWRFVGIELATKLHNENKNFYDLDQREIDTYLGNMFNSQ